MKKVLILFLCVLLVAAVSGCGKSIEESAQTIKNEASITQSDKKEVEKKQPDEKSVQEEKSAQAEKSSEKKAPDSKKSKPWPKEFAQWGIPVLDSADVSLTDNRSATQQGMTQGVNVVVNLNKLSKAEFEKYQKMVEQKGFKKTAKESVGDMLLNYEKPVDGGKIKLTIAYSEDTTTIVANNSAVAAQKETNAGGAVDWPESAKGIPVFTKGKFKETVLMGGEMYSITFLDVTDADLEWYRGVLKKEGFMRQESQDSEGYSRMENGKVYSVGFAMEKGTLQLIVLTGTME